MGLLNVAFIVSYIDRGILNLLVGPIKSSLGLSDTQVGLIQGTAFGLFFALMAVPFGWVADRFRRVWLIGAGIAVWSIMTAACGLATGFGQLFISRMGVGIGEATLSPTAPSLIADSFPPARRTLPLSLYLMAGGMGGGLALMAGGMLALSLRGTEQIAVPLLGLVEPWQVVFMAVGLPGLLVSLVFVAVPEPLRHDAGEPEATGRELLRAIVERRAILLPHFFGYCLFQTFGYAVTSWMPTYFIRVHGWTMSETGLKLGLTQIAFAIVGGLISGFLARALWQSGRRDANLLTLALMFLTLLVPAVTATLMPTGNTSLAMMAVVIAFSNAPGGASSAALQEIIPNRLRGRVTAIYYAVLSLVGISTGPVIVGLINDYGFRDPASVGKSISVVAVLTLPLAAASIFVAAARRRKLDWGK